MENILNVKIKLSIIENNTSYLKVPGQVGPKLDVGDWGVGESSLKELTLPRVAHATFNANIPIYRIKYINTRNHLH